MKPPSIPDYLKEKDWKTNVAPAIKAKWKSAPGMTLISTCLRSLDGALTDALKSHSPKAAKELEKACKTLDSNIKPLQKKLSAEKDSNTVSAINRHTEMMQKDLKKLKKNWNDYVSSWAVKSINAYPGMKKAFFERTKKEFSQENMLFLEEAVKTGPDPRKMYELYEKYIAGGAKYQINIPGRTKSKWEKSDAHATVKAYVKPKGGKATVDKLQATAAAKELLKIKGLACNDIDKCMNDTMGRYKSDCSIS